MADFNQPHSYFIELFESRFPKFDGKTVLDLGCGPGDISIRFARAYVDCRIDALDGSAQMLAYGQKIIDQQKLINRIQFHRCYLPVDVLPQLQYDAIISNSLLHHLANAVVLWQCIREASARGATVFIMDLLRPESVAQAQSLMNMYAEGEPEILRHDFYHSLLAAYTVEEVTAQLEEAELPLQVQAVSDRHLLISGRMPY